MFDFNKIGDFDKHIETSIPHFKDLGNIISSFAPYFIDENTNVYDLGCSTGKRLIQLSDHYIANFIGIDNSKLCPLSTDKLVFLNEDLLGVDIYNASMILSIFTLQFLNRENREVMLEKINAALNSGGCFICCEKVYSSAPKMQNIIDSLFYEYKAKTYTPDEILNKDRQLRKSLRLRSFDEVYDELSKIGNVDVFWRSFNFVGFIVTK
jgi:tRNA (cmo5U34)-methyltransferase